MVWFRVVWFRAAALVVLEVFVLAELLPVRGVTLSVRRLLSPDFDGATTRLNRVQIVRATTRFVRGSTSVDVRQVAALPGSAAPTVAADMAKAMDIANLAMLLLVRKTRLSNLNQPP